MKNEMIKISTSEHVSGVPWDYMGKSKIVKIFISYDDQGIHFLQFLHYEGRELQLTPRPKDSSAGSKFKTVKLNYPKEYLTSISGTYVPKDDGGKIISITFLTNKNIYHGPVGGNRPGVPEFKFELGKDRQFGGFHGSNYRNGMLETFGVYVKARGNKC
ncbi:hypothetical protein NMG60_11032973 [Bertholletia excelsa]